MATPEAPAASAQSGPNHGMRIFLIWLPLTVIADLLIWFALYPHLPPGRMSSSAQHQQFDIAFMGVAVRAGAAVRVDLRRVCPGQLASPGGR